MELSNCAYARHRGVSDTAVHKAIKNGRITKNSNGKIDKEIADVQWEANKRIEKERNYSLASQNDSGNNNHEILQNGKEEKKQGSINTSPSGSTGPSYQQSRTVREAYNAKMAKLQYDKEAGKLVSLEQMKIDAFNAGRITRDRILNVPNQAAPKLVGKTDIKEIQEILRKELTKALEELADTYGEPEHDIL